MGVSKNRGTPKWMVYNGKPYKNGWFGGTTVFGNIQIPHIECLGLGPASFNALFSAGQGTSTCGALRLEILLRLTDKLREGRASLDVWMVGPIDVDGDDGDPWNVY